MRKSRFNEEQIIAILKEAEAGIAPDELCRRHGITRGSLYRWKAKYGGMEVPGCMSHASIPAEVRDSVHVPSDTVRLSVGIEDSEDLISDLDEAFRFATTKSVPGAVSQERAAAD